MVQKYLFALRTDIDRVAAKRLRSYIRPMVLYVVAPYLSVTLIFTVFQRRLIYQPTKASRLAISDSSAAGLSGNDVELKTTDGQTLHGWWLRASAPERDHATKAPLLLYFPGNSLNRGERVSDLLEFMREGFDLLIFDYRGFGDSTGAPSEWALTSDARQIWTYALNELGYDERSIVIFGESLGGAVALSLWSDAAEKAPQPAALILNSTFTSMQDVAAVRYPLFPFQYLLLDRWRSKDRISKVAVPVIIFHGTEDEIVPVSLARQLSHAGTNVRLIEIQGGTHNEIPTARLRHELARLRN